MQMRLKLSGFQWVRTISIAALTHGIRYFFMNERTNACVLEFIHRKKKNYEKSIEQNGHIHFVHSLNSNRKWEITLYFYNTQKCNEFDIVYAF